MPSQLAPLSVALLNSENLSTQLRELRQDEIFRRVCAGEPQRRLAREYGLSSAAVNKIVQAARRAAEECTASTDRDACQG